METNNHETMDVDGEKDADMACSNDSIAGSDEMDSEEEEAREKELNEKKVQLQEKIKTDKTDYYAYTELIEVLQSLAQLDELRKAREDFLKEYPLSPKLWLSWIEDEKKVAVTDEEKEHVKRLFERALQDYLSVDIWLEYAQFSIGMMADGSQVETVRSVMERSLTISGLHVSKGAILWEVYREFEQAILLSLQEKKKKGEEIDDKIKEQNRKIAELFRRQLSVPLFDMDKTYEELKQWLEDDKIRQKLLDMELVENGYKKAFEKLEKILTFEESLLCAEDEGKSLPIYHTYLEFEKNPKEGGNDPFRVRSLYERALTAEPLNGSMWIDYIQFMSSNVRIPEDTIASCQRAVRNCPNESALWRYYMGELERYNKPKNEITDILNKGLQITFLTPSDYKSLWLAYIHYLRRRLNSVPESDEDKWEKCIEEIRKVLDMAFENLTNSFGTDGDPDCDILLWWARFEADTAKDLERYRTIWTDILNFGHDKSVLYWVKYINMEWQYGDAKHFRRLCTRALNAVPESPRSVVSLWLEYESHKGSLDSYLHCQRICDEKMKYYLAEKSKVKESLQDKKKKAVPKDKKNVKENSKKSPTKAETSNAEFKIPKPVSKSVSKDETNQKQKKQEVPTQTPVVHVPHDPTTDSRTIFVSNLEYTVTEDEVKEILKSVGTIVEFRLVRDYKGRSKGYGYLVFSSKKEAEEALKLDRTPINQRPMFISECDPDKQTRKSGLRFKTGLEKNKLFVKGLPFELKKEDIEKIFSPYGTLKDVRIVTYRNGHSKGLAYVEYEDEVSAAHALLKTDGLEIENKPLSVVISNPPERKLISGISDVSLGGGSVDKQNFGSRRAHTQLFVPRSVQANKDSKMDVTDIVPETTNKKSMSNADFKNLLFGNKK